MGSEEPAAGPTQIWAHTALAAAVGKEMRESPDPWKDFLAQGSGNSEVRGIPPTGSGRDGFEPENLAALG